MQLLCLSLVVMRCQPLRRALCLQFEFRDKICNKRLTCSLIQKSRTFKNK
ncbi:acetyltransferase [Vibrio cholerae]|nr:acetyltransferase [Vibrio cholerae]